MGLIECAEVETVHFKDHGTCNMTRILGPPSAHGVNCSDPYMLPSADVMMMSLAFLAVEVSTLHWSISSFDTCTQRGCMEVELGLQTITNITGFPDT